MPAKFVHNYIDLLLHLSTTNKTHTFVGHGVLKCLTIYINEFMKRFQEYYGTCNSPNRALKIVLTVLFNHKKRYILSKILSDVYRPLIFKECLMNFKNNACLVFAKCLQPMTVTYLPLRLSTMLKDALKAVSASRVVPVGTAMMHASLPLSWINDDHQGFRVPEWEPLGGHFPLSLTYCFPTSLFIFLDIIIFATCQTRVYLWSIRQST